MKIGLKRESADLFSSNCNYAILEEISEVFFHGEGGLGRQKCPQLEVVLSRHQ